MFMVVPRTLLKWLPHTLVSTSLRARISQTYTAVDATHVFIFTWCDRKCAQRLVKLRACIRVDNERACARWKVRDDLQLAARLASRRRDGRRDGRANPRMSNRSYASIRRPRSRKLQDAADRGRVTMAAFSRKRSFATVVRGFLKQAII